MAPEHITNRWKPRGRTKLVECTAPHIAHRRQLQHRSALWPQPHRHNSQPRICPLHGEIPRRKQRGTDQAKHLTELPTPIMTAHQGLEPLGGAIPNHHPQPAKQQRKHAAPRSPITGKDSAPEKRQVRGPVVKALRRSPSRRGTSPGLRCEVQEEALDIRAKLRRLTVILSRHANKTSRVGIG
ncbi:Hypothetical predicted protein [Pelobates cultripes]|uniref:Uncharacterized protein n=1 Tax=Pelobates cultripes TaxID=61616 RepID=A0AAD1VIV3_PELCU|nr:Hypothetical predicted protein [Pelobates cultripes]